MHDLALALDATILGDHAGGQNHSAKLLEDLLPDQDIGKPVSSSMVANIILLAEPGPGSADLVLNVLKDRGLVERSGSGAARSPFRWAMIEGGKERLRLAIA